jgi:hypothetical protein
MSILQNLRGYMNGSVNESALQNVAKYGDDDITEYEEDEQFMQECTAACMPTILQMMLMDESAESLDEAVATAFINAQDYLIGQGLMDEAAAVRITNPKINVVHLNKQAQIKRLTTIITLKMGRKADHKAYKKYKLGQKIKKVNLEELRRIYGQKAARLAKKLWTKNQKSAKLNAVVEKSKPAAASAKK